MTQTFEILLIDDNKDDLSVFKSHLRQASDRLYRFTEANSAEAGLALLRRKDYSPWCVLLDLHLPDMDGIGVLSEMKDGDGHVRFPVLMLTGSGSESGKARQALQHGAQDFIGKTWLTPDGLVRAVDNAVERFAMATELQRQRRDLERGKAMFKTLADNSPDIIARFDTDCRHLYVNPTVERVTGLPESFFVGRTNRELGMPEERCDLWDSKLREAVETRGRVVFEFSLDGTGGPRVYESRLTPEYDSDNHVVSVLAVATDVTDRKSLENALRTADRQKDEFLAMLGHELRNPLAPIRNAVAILGQAGAVLPDTRPLLELIGRQVDHLVRLVDDLLDVARVTRNKITLDREAVSIRTIVDRAVEIARPLVDARCHALAIDMPADPPWVHGDATRLVQVVMNLLNNAAKYTDPGGDIRLTVRSENDQAVVRVRDNGVGIADQMLPKVFELFTQVDATLDRSHGGLGLGLPLVRRLVEMHGGVVGVTSSGHGCGSEFTVRLPIHKRADLSKASGSIGPVPANKCRVLVIDDNRDAANSLATILKFRGHPVRTAYDGPSGIREAGDFTPKVVLLDIGLPGMSGYEVARTLKNGDFSPTPFVAAVTGYGMDDARYKSQASGFDVHFTKPLDLSALAKLLDDR